MNDETSLSTANELFARAERIHPKALRLNVGLGIAVEESLEVLHRNTVRYEITSQVLEGARAVGQGRATIEVRCCEQGPRLLAPPPAPQLLGESGASAQT